jgi:hypothetical protein
MLKSHVWFMFLGGSSVKLGGFGDVPLAQLTAVPIIVTHFYVC